MTMQNEMRDRLVPIVKDSLMKHIGKSCNLAEDIVDDLFEHGIIIPPCKVGTEVWFIRKDMVADDDYRMNFHSEWVMGKVHFQLSMIDKFGKTVFLTKEEAEKALKERKENG